MFQWCDSGRRIFQSATGYPSVWPHLSLFPSFRSKLEMTRNRMTNAAQLRDKSFRGDPRFSRVSNFHDTFYTGVSLVTSITLVVCGSLENTVERLRKIEAPYVGLYIFPFCYCSLQIFRFFRILFEILVVWRNCNEFHENIFAM